jgi:hypothetical protein
LKKQYDTAFNTPEGWLDSSWRDQPTTRIMPIAADAETGNAKLDSLLRSHMDHLADDPDLPPDISKPALPPLAVQDSVRVGPKPAIVMPTDAGFVAMRPELEAVERPTANESDLERVLTVAAWGELEDMCNTREFAYDTWTDVVFQGQIFEILNDARYDNKRIGEGPPVKSVVARTFLDVCRS